MVRRIGFHVCLLVIFLIGVFPSCGGESICQPATNGSEYISLYESTADSYMTPREMGEAHGEIVMIFMDILFNDKLVRDESLKNEFMANDGLNTEDFMEVMVLSVNKYLEFRGENIRMNLDDFKDFTKSVIQPLYDSKIDLISTKTCQPDNVRSFLKKMCSENLISEQTLYHCAGLVDRAELSFESLSPKNARTLLQSSPDLYEFENEGQVFEEILINSAEIWSLPELDSRLIIDPELKAWYDWFRESEKGKVIGGLLADAAGGLLVTAITGGNAYLGIVGGAGASIAFAFWACDGPLPW